MRQLPSFCPNCGWQNVAEVCGGDYPYWRRRKDTNRNEFPNIYFLLDLETEQPVRVAADWEGLDLGRFDELDYEDMLEHAETNGCLGEPICVTCGQHLTWMHPNGMSQILTWHLNEWRIRKLPNGKIADSAEGGNEFSVETYVQEVREYLAALVPGQYVIQVWDKDHLNQEWEKALQIGAFNNKEQEHGEQPNTK